MQVEQYRKAGLILEQDGMYLIIKDSRSHLWGFPKGIPNTDDDNDSRRTAARECEEETGVHVDVETLTPDMRLIFDEGKDRHVIFYQTTVDETGAVIPEFFLENVEVEEAAWLTKKEIRDLKRGVTDLTWKWLHGKYKTWEQQLSELEEAEALASRRQARADKKARKAAARQWIDEPEDAEVPEELQLVQKLAAEDAAEGPSAAEEPEAPVEEDEDEDDLLEYMVRMKMSGGKR